MSTCVMHNIGKYMFNKSLLLYQLQNNIHMCMNESFSKHYLFIPICKYLDTMQNIRLVTLGQHHIAHFTVTTEINPMYHQDEGP